MKSDDGERVKDERDKQGDGTKKESTNPTIRIESPNNPSAGNDREGIAPIRGPRVGVDRS